MDHFNTGPRSLTVRKSMASQPLRFERGSGARAPAPDSQLPEAPAASESRRRARRRRGVSSLPTTCPPSQPTGVAGRGSRKPRPSLGCLPGRRRSSRGSVRWGGALSLCFPWSRRPFPGEAGPARRTLGPEDSRRTRHEYILYEIKFHTCEIFGLPRVKF